MLPVSSPPGSPLNRGVCVCARVVMSPCTRSSASPVALPLYATALECIHQLVIEVKCASGFPQCPSTLFLSLFLIRSLLSSVLLCKKTEEKSWKVIVECCLLMDGWVGVCVCWSVVCCESVSWFSGAVSGLASTFDPATKQVLVLPQQGGDKKMNILMNNDSAEQRILGEKKVF